MDAASTSAASTAPKPTMPTMPATDPATGTNYIVYVAVAISALGGLFFGYDTGVISGTILFVAGEFSHSPGMEKLVVGAVLVGARVVSGIGIASFISPMYITELVPARVRGSLVGVNMLAITTGIVVAYQVDYAFLSEPRMAVHVWPDRRAFHWPGDRHVVAA